MPPRPGHSGKRERREPAIETSRRDWGLAALAVVGLLVSGYLTLTKLAGTTAAFCEAGTACDIVQASPYARLLGLPTAAWGVGYFAAVGALGLVGLTAQRWLVAFVLASGAVGFFGYLTYLELFVLRAVCAYCVGAAVAGVAIFGLLLARRPAPMGRKSWLRPGRLTTAGVLAAVVTIVFAAGAWVGSGPQTTSAYAEALARHLTASGAVFYGAFW